MRKVDRVARSLLASRLLLVSSLPFALRSLPILSSSSSHPLGGRSPAPTGRTEGDGRWERMGVENGTVTTI